MENLPADYIYLLPMSYSLSDNDFFLFKNVFIL